MSPPLTPAEWAEVEQRYNALGLTLAKHKPADTTTTFPPVVTPPVVPAPPTDETGWQLFKSYNITKRSDLPDIDCPREDMVRFENNVIVFDLKAGDPVSTQGGYRAEVNWQNKIPALGEYRYWRRFFIPNNWNQGSNPGSTDRIIHQFHSGNTEPSDPVLALRRFNGASAQVCQEVNDRVISLGTINITPNTWLDETVQVKWTPDLTGYVIWTIGGQTFTKTGIRTLQRSTSRIYEKSGIYHMAMLYFQHPEVKMWRRVA